MQSDAVETNHTAVFSITPEQSSVLRSWIEQQIGMVLPARQITLLDERVKHRLRHTGLDLVSYLRLIQQDAVELQQLTDHLVINETAFFRHPPSYDYVRQYLVKRQKPARLWSVGCSTGEETWSLAMLAHAAWPHGNQILGTDISQQALKVAQSGRYAARQAEAIPVDLREPYVQWLPSASRFKQEWQVADSLRPSVQFQKFNLVEIAKAPFRELDVIFCQNVLIYFRQFDRRDILDALAQRLTIGGVLVLGVGELSNWQHDKMRRINQTDILAYERI